MIYKRPESVAVFVLAGLRLLLLKRRRPLSFWQVVTGSLHWEESAAAAWRELAEETAVVPPFLQATGVSWVYPIPPAWRARYSPEVLENKEYIFVARLPAASAIVLSAEHSHYHWCLWPAAKACLPPFHQQIYQSLIHATPRHR
jgi:hypothetical protein